MADFKQSQSGCIKGYNSNNQRKLELLPGLTRNSMPIESVALADQVGTAFANMYSMIRTVGWDEMFTSPNPTEH